MKSYILLSLITLTLFSCKSDDDNTGGETDQPNLRVERKIVGSNVPQTSFIFTYNYLPNGKLGAVETFFSGANDDGTLSTYNYTNNRLSSITYSNGTSMLVTYEGDQIISRQLNNLTWNYSYNNDGNLEKTLEFQGSNEVGCETIYNFNNDGNLISESRECPQENITREYDDKENPDYLIFEDAYLKAIGSSNNNVTQRTATGANPQEEVFEFEYEYNEEGYPTKQTVLSNGEITTVNEWVYETVNQ